MNALGEYRGGEILFSMLNGTMLTPGRTAVLPWIVKVEYIKLESSKDLGR